jgi:hypothetical protein
MTTAEYYSIDIEDLPGIKLFEKHTHTHTHVKVRANLHRLTTYNVVHYM